MSPRDKWEIGPDGYPTSPDHPANRDQRTVAEVRAEIFQREIDLLERAFKIKGQSDAALELAVELCAEYFKLPPWVTDAVLARLRSPPKRSRGAPSKLLVHVARWHAVGIVREQHEDDDAPGSVYKRASDWLRETNLKAWGTPAQVKMSYRLVERRIRETGRPPRFFAHPEK